MCVVVVLSFIDLVKYYITKNQVVISMSKKKKKSSPKKTEECNREKVFSKAISSGESVRPVNEIYPKIFLPQDSLWTKVKRFFGYTT